MHELSLYAVALFVGFTLGATAHAQAPAPAPATVPDAVAPMDIPYGTPIILERAKAVAAAAATEARKRNWKMAMPSWSPAAIWFIT